MTHVDGHWFTQLSLTCRCDFIEITPHDDPSRLGRGGVCQDSLGQLDPRFFIIDSSCLLVNTPNDIRCFKLRLLWVRVIETMDACCTRYLLILDSSSRPCMVPVWANSEYGVTLGSRSGMYLFTLYEYVFNTCCSTSLYYIHAHTHLFAYLSLYFYV